MEKKELQGSYTGECKKGKAQGKGKAVGLDSYEGDFVSGLPHGRGTYRWANGDEYIGEFQKGLKEGEGKLLIKRPGQTDSLVEGYWHYDRYTGKEEKPWRLIFKSRLIYDLQVEYKDSLMNRITFVIINTSGGASRVEGDEMPRIKVDELILVKGAYGRIFINDVHAKKTESVVEEILYPIRFRAILGSEEMEMEFTRPGNYIVNLRIND